MSKTYPSRQAFQEAIAIPFNARLSRRLVPSVRGLYANGDMVVALFDGEAIARDGRPYRNTSSWYMQIRDDRIIAVTALL